MREGESLGTGHWRRHQRSHSGAIGGEAWLGEGRQQGPVSGRAEGVGGGAAASADDTALSGDDPEVIHA